MSGLLGPIFTAGGELIESVGPEIVSGGEEVISGAEGLFNDTPAMEAGVRGAENPITTTGEDAGNIEPQNGGGGGGTDENFNAPNKSGPGVGADALLAALTLPFLEKLLLNAVLLAIGLVIIFTALASKNQKLIINVAKDAVAAP